MNNLIIFLSVFLVFLASCNNQTHNLMSLKDSTIVANTIDDSKIVTERVELNKLELDDYPLCPIRCCMLDSLLIVQEDWIKNKENVFKVYYQNKLYTQFGMIGKGPNDFLAPTLFSNSYLCKDSLIISDFDKINSVFIHSNGYSKNTFSLPASLHHSNKFFQNNDSCIIFNRQGDYQLEYFNKKTDTLIGYNYYTKPSTVSDIPDMFCTTQLYQGAFSSNQQYIVIAYRNLKCIDIISMRDMTLSKRIYFNDYDINSFYIAHGNNIMFEDNTTYFFTYVLAQNSYFYALCWDKTKIDVKNASVDSKMYKITYDGEVEKIYEFNQPIGSFVIIDNTIIAIGLDHNERESLLYKGFLK